VVHDSCLAPGSVGVVPIAAQLVTL